jgi:hypothetical protein
MITSVERPTIQKYPSSSTRARSPVWNQPSRSSTCRVAVERNLAAREDLGEKVDPLAFDAVRGHDRDIVIESDT